LPSTTKTDPAKKNGEDVVVRGRRRRDDGLCGDRE
jgi:hypothetical protein